MQLSVLSGCQCSAEFLRKSSFFCPQLQPVGFMVAKILECVVSCIVRPSERNYQSLELIQLKKTDKFRLYARKTQGQVMLIFDEHLFQERLE